MALPAEISAASDSAGSDGHRPLLRLALVVGLFAATAAWFVETARFVHDEGLLTWLYASYLSQEPLPITFWLKAKPLLGLLNLPGTLFGLSGFYVGHIVIGALGLVATWFAARASGLRWPAIPVLVVATSPLYVAGTSSGLSNVDGVVVLSFALWLMYSGRLRTALFVAGAMPLIRFELGLMTLMIVMMCVRRTGSGRWLAWVTVPGISYALGGALYHGNVLWFVDFPPAWVAFDGKNANVEAQVEHLGATEFLEAILLTTPAMVILPLAGTMGAVRKRLQSDDRILAATLAIGFVTLSSFPFLKAFAGFSQRYYLFLLPLAALLFGRVIEAFRDSVPVRYTMAGAPLALGLAILFVAVPGLENELDVRQNNRGASEVADFIANHPELRREPIRTNSTILAALLEQRETSNDVQTLVAPDMLMELHGWSNPHNGQQQQIDELIRWRFYGRGISIKEFQNADSGSIYVLSSDERLEEVFPRDVVSRHAEFLFQNGRMSVLRLRTAVSLAMGSGGS